MCVMIVTLPMISNIQMCFWIFICVLLTMVNVCGFMQVLGMSIDMVSCIGLELAIGLCVDYATHVGHTFLTIPGASKEERSLKTVVTIGSAVVYGGVSMLIAVSMLGLSDAYNFQVFYKVISFLLQFFKCLYVIFADFRSCSSVRIIPRCCFLTCRSEPLWTQTLSCPQLASTRSWKYRNVIEVYSYISVEDNVVVHFTFLFLSTYYVLLVK